MKVLVVQLCPTLCDPMDCQGSSVHGLLQARILEWVAISSGDHPNPGIEPVSPTLQADSLLSETRRKSNCSLCYIINPCCLFYIW